MQKSLQKVSVRNAERGGAGVKLLIVLVVLFLAGHAGFNYIPVAYQYEDYKQRMNEIVINAFAMPNAASSTPEKTKERLRAFGNDSHVPPDAFIKVDKLNNGALQARVKFARQVDILPFGLYKYNYEFDYTAAPHGFLTKQ